MWSTREIVCTCPPFAKGLKELLLLTDDMTGREPVNIRRLLRENEQYAAASQYAQDVQRGDAVSSWHEHQSRKSSRPQQMPQGNLQSVDLKVVSCAPKDRMQRK